MIKDQPHHHANGEGAPAKAKAEYLVTLVKPVAAGELVDIDNVAFQPEAERAAEHGERLERRRADAVIVERHLIRSGKIKPFECAPDVGAPDLRRGISGAIREQNDFPAHANSRNDVARR